MSEVSLSQLWAVCRIAPGWLGSLSAGNNELPISLQPQGVWFSWTHAVWCWVKHAVSLIFPLEGSTEMWFSVLIQYLTTTAARDA